MPFYYVTGEIIYTGDVVRVGGKAAVVERIIDKHTADSKDFSCYETGGVLLAFQDGDLQLWPWIDEDLEFVDRSI